MPHDGRLDVSEHDEGIDSEPNFDALRPAGQSPAVRKSRTMCQKFGKTAAHPNRSSAVFCRYGDHTAGASPAA